MFSSLEEERTKFRNKKKKGKKDKKANKNFIVAKSGLVGMKEFYNHVKYFLPYLKPFLNEIAFYIKLSGRFSGPETKITRTIASKCDANIQLINLKLLSKFHVARSNRSRVISKSLKLRTS